VNKTRPAKLLRPGGVMRCCYDTLHKATVKEEEGEVLQCMYTEDPLHSLIFRRGYWEWNRPEDREVKP
jgi:hypothetical protein